MHPFNRALLLVIAAVGLVGLAWMTMTVSPTPDAGDEIRSVRAKPRPAADPTPARQVAANAPADQRVERSWRTNLGPPTTAAPEASSPPAPPPTAPAVGATAALQRFQEVAQEIDEMPCPDLAELTTPDLVVWISEVQGPIRENMHTATAELMASPSRTPGAGAMLQQRASFKAASCLLDLPIDDDPSTARAVATFCETARQSDEVVRQLRGQGQERGIAYGAAHADEMLSRCGSFAADFDID